MSIFDPLKINKFNTKSSNQYRINQFKALNMPDYGRVIHQQDIDLAEKIIKSQGYILPSQLEFSTYLLDTTYSVNTLNNTNNITMQDIFTDADQKISFPELVENTPMFLLLKISSLDVTYQLFTQDSTSPSTFSISSPFFNPLSATWTFALSDSTALSQSNYDLDCVEGKLNCLRYNSNNYQSINQPPAWDSLDAISVSSLSSGRPGMYIDGSTPAFLNLNTQLFSATATNYRQDPGLAVQWHISYTIVIHHLLN